MLAVTGITGHTGGFLIEELVKNQYPGKVKCLVRTKAKAEGLLNSGLDVEIVEGNLESEDALRQLLRNVDTVIHIAGIHYSSDILRIGNECGVRRFILIHTTGIYSKYKAASQEYIRIEKQITPQMKEMNITILRPTMIFGDVCDHNISKFISYVDKLLILPIVSGGRTRIQPVNARDLAQGIWKALQTEQCCGKAYDLSGEKAITLRQLYQMIGSYLDKRRCIVSFPMWLCVMGAYALKACSFGRIDVIEKVQRMGEDRAYSHAMAAEDFGYCPEPFEIGLKREVEEYVAKKQR